jgi:hypothetical protein
VLLLLLEVALWDPLRAQPKVAWALVLVRVHGCDSMLDRRARAALLGRNVMKGGPPQARRALVRVVG